MLMVSSNQAYDIKPGECKILTCMPFVISAAVPYSCIGDDNELYEMHTEVMFIDNSTKIECAQTLINCEDKNKINTFINTDMDFQRTTNSEFDFTRLEYNRFVESKPEDDFIILESSNSLYQLILSSDGNLILKNLDRIIWQNEMNYFNKSRIRITEKGHLIQEAKNFFSVDFRRDEWTTVWSTQPVNHNVTVDIPYLNGKTYVLVLSDTGVLNLYDAAGAIIWCSDNGK